MGLGMCDTQVVETWPGSLTSRSSSTSRITSHALAPKAAPKAAAAPASKPEATEPEASEAEAGCRSLVAWDFPGKGTVREGKGKFCRKMISIAYVIISIIQSIHVYGCAVLLAECPCLCQFSGDKSYYLPLVCHCLVWWAGWFRFCLPFVLLFDALCHPFVAPLLVPFSRAVFFSVMHVRRIRPSRLLCELSGPGGAPNLQLWRAVLVGFGKFHA